MDGADGTLLQMRTEIFPPGSDPAPVCSVKHTLFGGCFEEKSQKNFFEGQKKSQLHQAIDSEFRYLIVRTVSVKLEFIEFLKHRHRDSFAAPFDGMDYLKTVCFQPLYLPIKIVKRSNG